MNQGLAADMADTSIQLNAENYRSLIEQSPRAIVVLDLDVQRFIDVNESAVSLFGVSREELLLANLIDLSPPLQPDGSPSLELAREKIAGVVAGDTRPIEWTYRHAGGRHIPCEIWLAQLPVAGRKLFYASIVDITARKRAEVLRKGQSDMLEMVAKGQPLADRLARLMLLIESQAEGVYCSVLLLDEDGVHIRPGAGPSLPQEYMQALDGYPIGPCVGSCGTAMFRKETVIVADISSDPLWASYKGLVEPHGLRACWSTPIFLDRDLVLGSFAMYYREVRTPAAEDMRLIALATHIAGIAIERTRRERELWQHRHHLEELVEARTAELSVARERAEVSNLALSLANKDLANALHNLSVTQEELVRRDKLAALGSLVAGVAHELNTPIGNCLVVASTLADRTTGFAGEYARGLKRSALESYMGDASQASDILVRNLQRAADLVSSFKQIAVDQASSKRRKFLLSDFMMEIMLTLSPMLVKTPFSISRHIPDGLMMDSYPGPLGQVVTNLVGNCLVHAFHGRSSGNIRIAAETHQDGWVELSVSDDGVGIPAENLKRIYDPFFTTKLGAGGSGLGLHVTHNIVLGILGGRIAVASELGKGSSFMLSLPTAAPLRQVG